MPIGPLSSQCRKSVLAGGLGDGDPEELETQPTSPLSSLVRVKHADAPVQSLLETFLTPKIYPLLTQKFIVRRFTKTLSFPSSRRMLL